jgi:asparagine synthase (glutamine-hydrolysing)
MYDEPFADSSQIPTFLVSQLARQHVTVALSGDGADELFAGYRRHTDGAKVWRMIRRVPHAARALAARGLGRVPPALWDRVSGGSTASRLRHGVRSAAGHLSVRDRFGLYHRLSSSWLEPSALALGIPEPVAPISDVELRGGFADFTDEMTFLDLVSYLPGDILAKVDRATMAVSLEGRMPFLDHRVVELAWRIPLSMKVRDDRGKWILREVLHRYVPQEMVDRPKMGFGVPIDAWLRGPLREWADDLLDAGKLREEGFLDARRVHATWNDQLSNQGNHASQLWGVLMFQAWLRSLPSSAASV